MPVLRHLIAALAASALDFRDDVAAEVERIRATGEESASRRYDPASTTACVTDRADPARPYSAEITPGDIPEDRHAGFRLTG
jgi:hypothetical protein